MLVIHDVTSVVITMRVLQLHISTSAKTAHILSQKETSQMICLIISDYSVVISEQFKCKIILTRQCTYRTHKNVEHLLYIFYTNASHLSAVNCV